jgi:hypothetical protein
MTDRSGRTARKGTPAAIQDCNVDVQNVLTRANGGKAYAPGLTGKVIPSVPRAVVSGYLEMKLGARALPREAK